MIEQKTKTLLKALRLAPEVGRLVGKIVDIADNEWEVECLTTYVVEFFCKEICKTKTGDEKARFFVNLARAEKEISEEENGLV